MLTSSSRRPWNSTTKSTKKVEPFSPSPAPQSTKKTRQNSATKAKVATKPVPSTAPVISKPQPTPQFKPKSQIIQEFTTLIESKNYNEADLRSTLKKLRFLVYKHGIPSVQTRHGSLRSCIWKILLSVYRIDSIEYISLVSKGPSSVYEKIDNDVFRTLATDKDFKSVVTNEMLSRVLHAFVWKISSQPRSRLVNLTFSYVQGMNVLLAPFLYVMPELEAFGCFSNFILQSCPLYVQPSLEGVHCGLKLLDILLTHFDPELHSHLEKHQTRTEVYAFPWVMTFSACSPPLKQVLGLWDFYLAYGVHLHILTLVHVIISMRNEILQTDTPMKVLKSLPKVDAKAWVEGTSAYIKKCPEELYDLLVRHTYDPQVYEVIMED